MEELNSLQNAKKPVLVPGLFMTGIACLHKQAPSNVN